jgi:LytS/YehU family sensor histidine kinase
MRFGDRLRVRAELDPALADARVPSFALQTLVENAVRHGAAHRVAPTDVVVTARGTGAELTLRVWNADDEAPARATVRASADPTGGVTAGAAGTGLSRLRERLHYLYGDAARLTCGRGEDGGYEAVLVVPRRRSAA